MTAPGYRLDEAVDAVLSKLSDCSLLDDVGHDLHREIGEAIVRAIQAAAPQPEPPANSTFWAWLCNGKGDGWEEKDKVVHDPDLIKMRRERPDLWRIEGLYRAPAPGDDAKPEPPADLVERAAQFRLDDKVERKSISEMMAAFAQEHAAAEKARADKAEKALADEREACAQIVEKHAPASQDMTSTMIAEALDAAAAAIRARKGGGDG